MSEIIQLWPNIPPLAPQESYCIPDAHGRCLTCSDDAQHATVLHIEAATQMAVVEIDGVQTEIDISLVEDLSEGQIVLVHGGVALEKLEIGAEDS